MAKKSEASVAGPNPKNRHRRTSVGNSPNTRPTNKSKRRTFKRSRGQG